MCGICDELRFDGSIADMSAIERMSNKIARRGPDHAGVFSDGPLAFNGTIYNYQELRAELVATGYRFFSESDSEVILKAYHAWGAHCVQRFFGMFAFAVWDQRDASLFMARDRFGIKPLYYTLDGSRLRFASSLQALLAAGGVDTGIDPVALHHHFTLHAVVPAPRTILKGIRKLAPATTITINGSGQIEEAIYWQLDATRPAQPLSEAQWLAATRDVLLRAVERHRLAADVPVGVLLSGGLDSSLLAGLLADHVDDLQTFSMGFETLGEGSEKADEFEFSDQVAEQFATRHHKYLIPYDEVLRRLPEAVLQMAEPMVSQDVIAFYLLGERVSKQVKVVISGQGAAEGTALERFSAHYFDRDHAEYLEMVTPAYYVPDGPDVTAALVAKALAQPQADTFIDQVLRFDTTTLLVDDPVKRVDNMAMAWGLAARMPPELKLKQGGKFPLKAISRGLISDAVIDRPKGYFPVPVLKHVSSAVCTNAPMSTSCSRHPRPGLPASRAASYGIWHCWNCGCN